MKVIYSHCSIQITRIAITFVVIILERVTGTCLAVLALSSRGEDIGHHQVGMNQQVNSAKQLHLVRNLKTVVVEITLYFNLGTGALFWGN